MDRHDKIQSFKAELYWVVQAKVSSPVAAVNLIWLHLFHNPFCFLFCLFAYRSAECLNVTLASLKNVYISVYFVFKQVFKGKDSPITLDWDRVRVFDRDVGQMFVNMAKTAKEAKVCFMPEFNFSVSHSLTRVWRPSIVYFVPPIFFLITT